MHRGYWQSRMGIQNEVYPETNILPETFASRKELNIFATPHHV